MKELESKCNLCDGDCADLLYRRPRWTVWRCRDCGLVYVKTDPVGTASENEAGGEQEAEGKRHMKEVFIDRHDFWMDYWRHQVDRLKPLLATTSPHLLDIGCAMGHFTLAAQEAGWQTVGIELSHKRAVHAREVFGLDVRASLIEDADLAPESFDVVTLWSVIEHTHDPKAVMSKVATLIKPGGLVVIKTPNQDSLITLLAHWSYVLSAGRYLLPVYSDDHVYRFSDRTLRRLLKDTGFEVVKIMQDDNLQVMQARMHLQEHRAWRNMALAAIHSLAGPIRKENQLLAYAQRPRPSG